MAIKPMDVETCLRLGGKPEHGVCMVDGYPMATGEQIDVPILHDWVMKSRDATDWFGPRLVRMSPDAFLKIAPPTRYIREQIDYLKGRIRERKPLDAVWLEFALHPREGVRLASHEGRHRAKAAKEQDLELIPVFINNYQGG